jgi:hypothetical protein
LKGDLNKSFYPVRKAFVYHLKEGYMFRKIFRYIWGTIVRPKATFDELAQQTSIRPAVMLVILAQLLETLNWLIFVVFGQDWLGTRRELPNPTFVGFFGRLPVGIEHYVPIFFFVIGPLLALLGPVVIPGLAHVLSKLWRGQGTFEQMVNTLGYAQVPSFLIQLCLTDILIGGVPANLLTKHPYAFTAAMNGEFGSLWVTLSWLYMFGIYIFGTGLWIIILGTIAICRVQRIPWWAAAFIMLFSYILWFYGLAGLVVR